jgi:hypothetical protein
MNDKTRPTPAEDPSFETDTVQADLAREQGLGLGERELKAQRDPGGVRTANEDSDIEDGVDTDDDRPDKEQPSSTNDV